MSQIMFSSGVELGKFASSLDIIQEAYQAILASSETTLTYKLHTSRSGIKILAFKCPSDYTTQFLEKKFVLVTSENLPVVDFISTKVNSLFSINEAAVELFQQLGDDLKKLENEHINTSSIITGSGLGGYIAILFTLHLHNAIDVEESNESKETKRPTDVEESNQTKKTKRPICITFGCPLVGDVALQGAIAERPQWKSSFLNVVAKKDVFASFFSSETLYKPLGTFLFCTESADHAAFDDEDSILLVLDAMKLLNEGNSQVYDYTNALNLIRRKVLYRGNSELGEFNMNFLRAGITLQLRKIGVLDGVSDDQIGEMERKQIERIESRNPKNSYEDVKKLNEMKISLALMEWYMKSRKQKGGYYDVYKNPARDEIDVRNVIVVHQGHLNQYWKKVIEETNLMPQKEGAKLRKRWLYSGNNYRKIVEPLDIATYYNKGNIKYKENRSNHYILLEKWSDEDKKKTQNSSEEKRNKKKTENSSEEKRNKAASLTEDSCFWAHVEEALISLQHIENGESSNSEKELERFEAYVICVIKSYSVSPDIFLEGSSFMEWWKKYKAYKGTGYDSEFAQYMNNESYKSYK